jgi:hypothetical protein
MALPSFRWLTRHVHRRTPPKVLAEFPVDDFWDFWDR